MHTYVKAAIVSIIVVYLANRVDMTAKYLGPKALHP